MHPDWLQFDWRQPGVRSVATTRRGGVSAAPWHSMNLGAAVGDDPGCVARNRRLLRDALGAEPVFMKQVHGTRVVRLTHAHLRGPTLQADACVTTDCGVACTVQMADCLPVLMAAPGAVAAAHAGWRGLAHGVLEATVQTLCEVAGCDASRIECWLGPCIGPQAFEVGADVLHGFGVAPEAADPLRFRPHRDGKWLANLPGLARDRLARLGVPQVSGGSWCTVADAERFFSYRRDAVTGRMGASIWREAA